MTDYERDLAAGGKPVQSDYERDLAAGGVPVSQPRDKGMRPDVAPDDVSPEDVKPDYGKRDARSFLGGHGDSFITLPGTREAKSERRKAEDPIKNDPLAGMILQGMAGWGAGSAATPLVGQLAGRMIGGAVTSPDEPITGALMAGIPGVPGAVRTADRIVGEKALARMNSAEPSLVPAAKAAGTAIGTVAGHSAVPFVGAPIGGVLGNKLGGKVGAMADKGVNALGRRRMMQMAETTPQTEIPGIFGVEAEGAARKPLEPLVPKAGEIWDPEAAAWEFGERPRGQKTMYPGAEEAAGARASEPKMTETSEAGTAAIPKPSFSADVISHTKNGKTLADAVKAAEEGPSLREAVSRDAKANVKGPGGGAFEHPDTPTDLAESLKASIEMAQKLRAAKAAGTLTPEMVKAARDAGMSPAFIKQLGGVAN